MPEPILNDKKIAHARSLTARKQKKKKNGGAFDWCRWRWCLFGLDGPCRLPGCEVTTNIMPWRVYKSRGDFSANFLVQNLYLYSDLHGMRVGKTLASVFCAAFACLFLGITPQDMYFLLYFLGSTLCCVIPFKLKTCHAVYVWALYRRYWSGDIKLYTVLLEHVVAPRSVPVLISCSCYWKGMWKREVQALPEWVGSHPSPPHLPPPFFCACFSYDIIQDRWPVARVLNLFMFEAVWLYMLLNGISAAHATAWSFTSSTLC